MKKNIILAAGGTGGHIYPAIAVAQMLEGLSDDLDIHFWGATKGLENKIVPSYGYKLHRAQMGRLNHNVKTSERLLTLFLLPLAIVKSFFLILRLKPRFVMGFGGHASAPLVLAAKLLRKTIFLWEPNAIPGLANRKLSAFANEAFVVFEKSKMYMKCPIKDFGMPIRGEVENSNQKKVKSDSFNVLVFGGSQGSLAINEIMIKAIQTGLLSENINIKLQTGELGFQQTQDALKSFENVEVVDYIHNMPDNYSWADVTIARAGTGTLSELASVSMPSILIPLPNAADNHQFYNAKALADKEATILLEQSKAQDNEIVNLILELKKDRESLNSLSENIKSFYQPNSAKNIAEYLLTFS